MFQDTLSFFVTNKKQRDADEINKEHELSFQTREGQLQISKDLSADSRVMKELLYHHIAENAQDIRAML